MPHAAIKVGLFFGGSSREREVSFVGGRTAYDHLDRKLFEPVPVFVDSLGNFILLRWQYLYQGSIRELSTSLNFCGIPLYIESLATEKEAYIAAIGEKVAPADFSKHFDLAFLCLHGPYGEDGTIQGILQWYQMPYTGSGLLPSALGLHKIVQKKILQNAGFLLPNSFILSKTQWLHTHAHNDLLDQIFATLGLPFVVKSSTQGSSIGVTIVQNHDLASFTTAVDRAFFIETITYASWSAESDTKDWLARLIDVRTGIGFPLLIADQIFYTPTTLLNHIEGHFQQNKAPIVLISTQSVEEIIIEAFIEGREFSCVVLEAAKGQPIALPPTEIFKQGHFDYRAKYLPGIVRKQTPMAVPGPLLEAIRKEVVALFQLLHCQVYARIDGFLTSNNQLFLNDPNTTAGMHPSSCLFHQAAEIGLNPTQLLTFLIKRSLEVRKEEGYLMAPTLLERLETMLL